MGATSITGTGPGDSNKRVAYLSSDLPKEAITTTTSNPQDLITTTDGGGGGDCGCDFGSEWELVFSRAVDGQAEPDDPSPVPTGVLFDSQYEWALGVHEVPLEFVFGFSPITDPVLVSVLNLNTTLPFNGIQWSPDGGTTVFNFGFQNDQVTFMAAGAIPPSGSIDLVSPGQCILSLDSGEFYTFFSDSFGSIDGYFVIARRAIGQ